MKNILKSLLAIAFVAMLSSYANAQTKTKLCFQTGTSVLSCQDVTAANPLPVTQGGSGSQPITGTTTTVNSTVTPTNTFATALASSATRKGCLLQNTGTHVQYVYFGVLGSATTTNSFQVNAGQTISCASGPIVLTDAVNIAGTAGDAYVVTSQ